VGGTGNDIIYGGTGDATITGGGGDDEITGGAGNDIIYGGTASSSLTGGNGNVSIFGGSGNDIIYGGYGKNTIFGGSGNDSIVGGTGNDVVYGGAGDTTITGGGGDDTLIGGTGNDIIYGGSSSSSLTGGSGHVSIIGGTGNDIIYGGYGTNTITGGSGDDSIFGGPGDDVIYAGSGRSTITGGGGHDSITGGTGNDIIYGGDQSSTLTGGTGDDTIVGGAGNDVISGGSGNCSIRGGGGNDSITGGSGNDIIQAGPQASTITGGSGNDSITGGSGNDIIYGGSGRSTIAGGGGNDSITGGKGNDIIYGGSGNDTLSGGTGDATISGGGGDDLITAGGSDSWIALYGSMNMTLSNATLSTSGGGSVPAVSTISGFHHAILSAGPGDFTLDASAFSGGVLLLGGTGNDTLIGTSGGDTLTSGAGNDSLIGGGGDDTFAFDGNSSGNQNVVEAAGTGNALLDFSAAPAGIQIDLGQTGPQTVIANTLTLTLADPLGIANVLGSPYDDTIIGNARDNTLVGGGGQDVIAGLAGNDLLQGGATRTVLLDFDTLAIPGEHVYTQAERDAIQAQLAADYSAFSYAFTQTPPSSGHYTTIYFDDPRLVGLEGGLSTSVDWRDLNISGAVSFGPNGLQITPADTASVNVNNLLGSPGEPAASSADFIALSTTIAAHELGHLSGLEHGDSYGPIGSGIYVGVNPGLYRPAYAGPTGAGETVEHVMASGASVNATLFDAINSPFFGEREAVKLAFGEDGSPTNEQTAPHFTKATAQPLALAPLVVPDTVLKGVNADRVFDVTAADVVGELGLDASGNSNTDFYSFTAQAGTLLNLQVMSRVLDRPAGSFDSTMTVYDSNGNVIAFNDDSFQNQDSTIIDLTIPSTGTYYIEVTAYSNPGENTQQTGAYELFLYTFAASADPPAGDSMYAGSGNDTILGGAGDDTIVAQQPKDTVVYGSGSATLLAKAPYLDVSAGANQTVNEGSAVTLNGSFVDPFDSDAHNFDWHVADSSGQQFADGTGPSFTFSPGNAGTYTVTFIVSDTQGGSASATVQVTSLAVPPALTPPAASQSGVALISAPVSLGTLAVAGIGPWTASVQWGDGQSSTFSPSGSGPLSLAHAYPREGSYYISETVSEFEGDSTSITFPNPVVVVDQPVSMTVVPVAAIVGVSTGSVLVATFTDPEGADPLGDYGASISWGDSQSSTGTINYNSGTGVFSVNGTHTYANAGTDTISITVSHVNAPTATAASQAKVAQASSSTSLSTSSASVVYGQTVTFTAIVTGYGTPTGSLTFYAGPVNAADQIGTATLSVVKGQDTATLSDSKLTVSGSPYTITAVYGGDTNNLGSTSKALSQTITTAPLLITANNQTKVYGQANPAMTVSYSGFVNGDTSASLTTQPTVTTTATTTSTTGTYPITASGAVDANYTISYAAGTLTINADASSTSASSSATNGPFGQAITLSATVAANAPGSGTPTGTVDFYDTTTGYDLGKGTLSGGATSLKLTSLSPGSHVISASYSGDKNFLASSANLSTITVGQSIIVLDSAVSGALTVSANAIINIGGGVYADSSSSSALTASGNASITASVINVHGGVKKSGNAVFNPAPVTGAATLADPLSGLAGPSTSGQTSYGSVSLSGNSKVTIKPGIYTQISVSGNAVLTMGAGVYMIEGGGFSVTLNAGVTGSGVMIFNAGSKYPNSGGNYGSITLSSSGTQNLTAPTSGMYAGLLFFQPRDNAKGMSFSGSATTLTGTVYAPTAQLSESGSAQLNGAVVVDQLMISGNGITNSASNSSGLGMAAAPAQAAHSATGVGGIGTSYAPSASPAAGTIGRAIEPPTARIGDTPNRMMAAQSPDGPRSEYAEATQSSDAARFDAQVVMTGTEETSDVGSMGMALASPAKSEHSFVDNLVNQETDSVTIAGARDSLVSDTVLDEVVRELVGLRWLGAKPAYGLGDALYREMSESEALEDEARWSGLSLAGYAASAVAPPPLSREPRDPLAGLASVAFIVGMCDPVRGGLRARLVLGRDRFLRREFRKLGPRKRVNRVR
jgi:Ca2+-binding RTX toxin-like protein